MNFSKTIASSSSLTIMKILLSFAVCTALFQPAGALPATHYADCSVLSSGTWVKVAVSQRGVYRIDAATLQAWGFADASTVCVVENVQDVMAIEGTRQFTGLYHVLGGVISPMDGVGPGDLEIDSLVERVKAGGVAEVILALSATMEGDTTGFYIFRKLEHQDVKLSVIARGVSIGDELEYTDEVTLGRSIVNRTPFNGTM